MKFVAPAFRKIGILLVGIPLMIIGLILIPLPGPGLLVCFAALFLLSLEFDWAKVPMEKMKSRLKQLWEKSQPPQS